MNTINLTRLFLLTTVLFAPFAVLASNQTEKLEQEALIYLHEHYNKTKPDARTEIKLNPISRKIKLKACIQPIEFQTPKGNGSRITFKARCPSPLWQLFISAQVNHYGPAVITNHSLPRNTVIKSSHLSVTEVDVTNLRSAYFTNSKDIVDWTTKRSIAAGSIITANMLKTPIAIRKGNSLLIEARRNGVTIRASGTALEDGEIGKQIKVKNDRSGNILKALVVQPGLVRAP